MGQTLTNGVYLPDNGERNCYTGLSQNWQKLDNLLGNQGSNVSFSQTLTEGVEIGKITINGTEISMYHTDYSGKANASDLTTHTSNADIHVTSTDKATWNGKQSALTDAQLNACNSGITSDKVATYDWYASTKVNKSGDTMTGDLLGNGSNNLGTSSNKWKTINGINPGALSLPDYSKGFSIIGNFNPTNTTDKGSWTATCDCIVYVCVLDGEGSFSIGEKGTYYWFRRGINALWGYATIWFLASKGDRVALNNFGSSQGYNTGSFVFVVAYPCQGNV